MTIQKTHSLSKRVTILEKRFAILTQQIDENLKQVETVLSNHYKAIKQQSELLSDINTLNKLVQSPAPLAPEDIQVGPTKETPNEKQSNT